MRKTTVLITGGAGYIGSNLCLVLLQNGYSVVLVDNFSNSNPGIFSIIGDANEGKFPGNLKIYNEDVRGIHNLHKIFSSHKIDHIVHLAGYKVVPESVVNPLKYYNNNLLSTVNVAEMATLYGVRSILFSSTATTYKAKDIPLKETDELVGTSAYAHTKIASEFILRDMQNDPSNAIQTVVFRYFNPLGAVDNNKFLADTSPYCLSTAISNAIKKLAQLDKNSDCVLPTFTVFGNDHRTKDGTCIRDYIHIKDVVHAHIKAIEMIDNGILYDSHYTMNIGSGKGASVLEILKVFLDEFGIYIPYTFGPRRKGDTHTLIADISLAKLLIGFEPQYSIEDMCRSIYYTLS